MAKKVDETARKLVHEAGFEIVEAIATTSRTAELYKAYDLHRQHLFVVKIYRGSANDGIKAQHLYELELLAMKSLATTRRVPEVFYYSVADGATSGQQPIFFMVKPYYENFLDRTIRDTPALELLEHAAQQADISDQLLSRGWRDFDGSFMNDAIDEQGRLVRVDLDGAKPAMNAGGKLQKKYQTEDEFNAILEWLKLYASIFSDTAEAGSLAVRISRLLLRNEEEDWPELRTVMALRKGATPPARPQDVDDKKSWSGLTDQLKTVYARFTSSRSKEGAPGTGAGVGKKRGGGTTAAPAPEAEEPPHKTPEEEALEGWSDIWRKGTAGGGETSWWDGRLKNAEARLLALLTFHILSQREHGFRVRDLYESLLLLTVAGVEDRWQSIKSGAAELTGHERKQFMSLVEDLHEVQALLAEFQVAESEDAAAREEPMTERPPEYKVGKVVNSGAAWPSTKKGPEWLCQDLVIISKEDALTPIFLLADGASRANGTLAVEKVKAVAVNWQRPQQYASLAEAKDNLCRLVTSIHEEVSRLRHRAPGKNFETTLVVATIYTGPPNPVLLLIRYGNSGYFATCQRDGEEAPEPILDSRAYDTFPDPIGSRRFAHVGFNPRDTLEEVQLSEAAVYRVRAFSDGVGTEDQAWELLGDAKGIKELTDEAREWPSSYGHIGHDDWSIAGFDIEVVPKPETPTIDSPYYRETRSRKRLPFPWASLGRVPANRFKLSKRAELFWKSVLTTDSQLSELAKYTLVKNLFRAGPAAAGSTFKAPSRTAPAKVSAGAVSVYQENPRRDFDKRRASPLSAWLASHGAELFIWGGLFLVVCILLFNYLYRGGSPPNPDVPPVGPAPAATLPTPSFDNQRQREIYTGLQSAGGLVVTDLKGGSGVDEEPLKSFLPNLAAVLSKTGLRVTIDVHTDPEGSESGNRNNTDARKRAIEEKLKSLNVRQERFEVRSMGETTPPSRERFPNPTANDYRRLELRLKQSAP